MNYMKTATIVAALSSLAFTNLDILRCEDEHRACIEHAISGTEPTPAPVPTRTPKPTATPVTTGTPPSNANCADGILNRSTSSGMWGLRRVTINPGEVKHFCADVNPPLVNGLVSRIFTTWGDATDYECGAIRVTMRQTFPAFRIAGPSTGTSGNVRFTRTAFRQPDCLECVAPGRYEIIAEGIALYNPADPNCNRFAISWGTNE
jgi:hypothetical protein